MDELKIKCTGSGFRLIKDIKPFQGNLKNLSKVNYEKLKKNLLDNGFCEPICVWNDKVVSGHQRLRALQEMEKEGYFIPAIPVNTVEAKTVKEAKKIILALTSQYGEMNQESLADYMLEADLKLDDIDNFVLPNTDLDFEDIEDKTEKEPEEKPEEPTQCPECGFEFYIKAYEKLYITQKKAERI